MDWFWGGQKRLASRAHWATNMGEDRSVPSVGPGGLDHRLDVVQGRVSATLVSRGQDVASPGVGGIDGVAAGSSHIIGGAEEHHLRGVEVTLQPIRSP